MRSRSRRLEAQMKEGPQIKAEKGKIMLSGSLDNLQCYFDVCHSGNWGSSFVE